MSIIADLVGAAAVSGYRLICDPLVEEALKTRQARHTHDTTHGTESP